MKEDTDSRRCRHCGAGGEIRPLRRMTRVTRGTLAARLATRVNGPVPPVPKQRAARNAQRRGPAGLARQEPFVAGCANRLATGLPTANEPLHRVARQIGLVGRTVSCHAAASRPNAAAKFGKRLPFPARPGVRSGPRESGDKEVVSAKGAPPLPAALTPPMNRPRLGTLSQRRRARKDGKGRWRLHWSDSASRPETRPAHQSLEADAPTPRARGPKASPDGPIPSDRLTTPSPRCARIFFASV